MKKIITSSLATVLLAMALVGCSQRTTPSAETKEPYTGPQISYTNDVAPIITRSCAPCHFPEKRGKKEPLHTYASMKAELNKVLIRVQLPESDKDFMPFKKKKPSLTAEEIELLKNWARGGFQE